MSQQVQIDYNYIACQCNTICNMAKQRLKELDDMLVQIENTATRLLNNQTESLKTAIAKEKAALIKQIKVVNDKANEDANMGVVKTYNHDDRYVHRDDTINAAKNLEEMVNVLSSQKLIEFQSLLDNLLKESSNDAYRKLLERANGNVVIDEQTQKLLNSIQDDVLRQFTYLTYIKNNTLSGDALIKAGEALMEESINSTYESRLAFEEERVRKEMEAARVDKDIIAKVVSKKEGTAKERLSQMQTQATTEVIGETVRQQSLIVIMKAITARGFIFDKKNIKINLETNEVHMVAMKASGERADFKIYMDGKFIYDFHHGYQGQACQKDIEPFIKDLEDVYGIHITKSQEIWSNPNKISTMKYQAMNTNKNKR